MRNKECIAMLLAGGQGSRLYLLTQQIAKPAVSFGGKYKIIDFPLSNCINSGIDTVGVMTQYQPLMLNEYIGNGQPWDLDRTYGGVMILQPYQASKKADWYKGTANAIYQNLNFIDKYDPEYVLVLSGDHIYKMDYRAMLDFHIKNNSDCTIAVIKVPQEEASRFGILSLRPDMSISEFQEKPKNPKSTMASMGVYIFSKEKLKKYLIMDEENENSSKDFGKDVIPAMFNSGERMFAYKFEGYWKDVGTIESLWEANMDLLGDKPEFNLHDSRSRISSRNYADPPHYVGFDAVIQNSIITEGCEIKGTVINSVISEGVFVDSGAVIKDSVIMRNCIINKNVVINYSIIDSNTVVGSNTIIGEEKESSSGITLIENHLIIPSNMKIPSDVMVDSKYISKNTGAKE
ncbi:MAG: glucose-1-phosphate adenylyltransferase [Clostridiales bacterium GWF2_38_85]|nr:MAG: glucose-1-phosphate adenylyltransferase [Clostridiales bacterium GWF2_38_85]